jgi:hypothetical protein
MGLLLLCCPDARLIRVPDEHRWYGPHLIFATIGVGSDLIWIDVVAICFEKSCLAEGKLFSVVTMLPPDESFNVSWFIDQNLVPLVQFLSIWLESNAKEWMVHVDNAPPHNSRMT